MTDIDFGTLISAIVGELNCTASELSEDERTDTDAAVERYKRNVIGAVRTVFDEAENSAQAAPACSPTLAQRHDRAQKIDYSDPFVRALLSPGVIRQMKEILAEGDDPRVQEDLKSAPV